METLTATPMTHQEGLNQVVINKVQRMIDGKAVGVQATMERRSIQRTEGSFPLSVL